MESAVDANDRLPGHLEVQAGFARRILLPRADDPRLFSGESDVDEAIGFDGAAELGDDYHLGFVDEEQASVAGDGDDH